ncbi:hypothetical protein N2152v2_009098 [Parachlorella kessleri]
MDSSGAEPLTASLALALSGFAVDRDSQHSAQLPRRRGAKQGRLVPVTCTSVSPLVQHARQLVAQLVATSPGSKEFGQVVEQLEGLCFGLRSTLGLNGQLPEEEEEDLWAISTQLWEASLNRPDHEAQALANLAKELFELIESKCDRSEECANFVSFFAKMASAWAKLGKQEQARWCIDKAMRFSEQLETMLNTAEVPADSQERCVVQLFTLYMEAAKNALETRQQALANNLMSRAVQLSRHDSVSPTSAASMCITITQLQLQQAQELDDGATVPAIALLTAAYQQLAAAGEVAVAAGGEMWEAVLLQLCKAHLRAGDAKLALKCLENAGLGGGSIAGLQPDAQLLVMRVTLEAGRQAEALQHLLSLMAAIDMTGEGDQAGLQTWLACLRLALPGIATESLAAFKSVITTSVWKAASQPACLLKVLQCLLAVEKVEARDLCQGMALDTLAQEQVTIGIHKEEEARKQCYAMLWHKAAQLFSASDVPAARSLFSAALQYCSPGSRPKTARMLSACHAQLGQHQRALEYLSVAARQEEHDSVATQFMRLQALVALRNHEEAVEVIEGLPACHDFHASCVPAAVEAAAGAEHPLPAKEAFCMAVRELINADSPSPSLPPGQEAYWLLNCASAVRQCISYSADGPASEALFRELATTIRLATKRISLTSLERFAGQNKKAVLEGLSSHALNGGLQAYTAGVLEPCVMLLSSSCVLLKELDSLQCSGSGCSTMGKQASALMVATQALLDLHQAAATESRAGKLILAQKLLCRMKELVAEIPKEQADIHEGCLVLAVMVFSRLPAETEALKAMQELQRSPRPLAVTSCRALLEQLSTSRSHPTEQLQAEMCRLAASSMQQASNAAEALSLAVRVSQMVDAERCPQPVQLVLKACCERLQADHGHGDSRAANLRPREQASLQWLVACTWNTGQKLTDEGRHDEGKTLLSLAVCLLDAVNTASHSKQARQLEHAMAQLKMTAADCPGDAVTSVLHKEQAVRSIDQAGQSPASSPSMVDVTVKGLPASGFVGARPSAKPAGDIPASLQASSINVMGAVTARKGLTSAAIVREINMSQATLEPAGAEAVQQPAAATQDPLLAATVGSPQPQPCQQDAAQAAGLGAASRIASQGSQHSDSEEDMSSDEQGVSWLDAIAAARRKCDSNQAGVRKQPDQQVTPPGGKQGLQLPPVRAKWRSAQAGNLHRTAALPSCFSKPSTADAGKQNQQQLPAAGLGPSAGCHMREPASGDAALASAKAAPAVSPMQHSAFSTDSEEKTGAANEAGSGSGEGTGLVLGTEGADELCLDDDLMDLD